MAIPNLPKVTSEIVDLVETMRQAQKEYFKLASDRESNATQHQLRRALQDAKATEKKVDDWLERYRAEARAWYAAQGDYKTDELPGQYKLIGE